MRPIYQRYLIFCLTVVSLFALYSYTLDQIFYRIDYGNKYNYRYSILDYFVYFIILQFPLAIGFSILYNFIVNEAIEYMPWRIFVRFLFALLVGFSIGLLMKRNGVSFYIGKMRPVKNVILYPSIYVTVEILRLLKSKINWTDIRKYIPMQWARRSR